MRTDQANKIAEQSSRTTAAGNGLVALLKGDGATPVVLRAIAPAAALIPAIIGTAHAAGVLSSPTLIALAYGVAFAAATAIAVLLLRRVDAHQHQQVSDLERARDEANEANNIKSAYLASMSHEVRTPLTAIVGFADLLLNPSRTTEERLEFARTIRRNGEHLLTITSDILDLSKIEAGKMRVENIVCSPAELIAEVVSMLRAPAIDKNLSLEVTYDGVIPSRIRTDPTRVRQALINLIGNAIKFTESGGVQVIAGMATPTTDARPMFRISVTDTGIGLTPEQQKNLFTPFIQADVETSRRFGGTGLGLAIAKHLAELLGGGISVTSEPGRGSTFTISINTGPLDGIPLLHDPQEAMLKQAPELPEKFELHGNVLLAEDGASNQRLITLYLREAGANVEVAPNGKVAVEMALNALERGASYDLILMDMQMPVLDGYQATMQLRDRGYKRPIVALTANALAGDRHKCLNAGCNDFMTKPIDPVEFLKMVSRHLRGNMRIGKPPTADAA